MLIKYILVSKQSRPGECLSLYFVLRTFKRSYDASQNLWCTVRPSILRSRYFLEYHPSSSNIAHCQVPSRVRAWFHDSAGDINFYHMSLSQSELTILHESIIYTDIYIYIYRLIHNDKRTIEQGVCPCYIFCQK